MLEEVKDLKIDGIICGNIGILEHLKTTGYTGKINISTILAVYNSEAIRFLLENYTINKIILSREITLKEIEYLVTTFPKTDFEVFGEGDFCRYNNGLCYAEHKYGAKDICTIVVNDLVYKKRFRADFKKIISDASLTEIQKVEALDDDYADVFDEVGDILQNIELSLEDETQLQKSLLKLLYNARLRIDLYFDAMKPITDERNRKILTFLKGLRYILESSCVISKEKKEILLTLKTELEDSVKK